MSQAFDLRATLATPPMPHRTAFDPKRRLAAVRLTGEIDGDELVATTTALLRDAGTGPLDIVWDATYITGLHLVPGDLERILEVKRHRPATSAEVRHDVLVTRRTLDVLIARLFVLLARRQGMYVTVCRSTEEAGKVLGVSDLPEEEPASVG